MSVAQAIVDRLPTMQATIDRRVFVTFRTDPDALRTLVPDDYELLLTDGYAVGGVCLIRLGDMRPNHFPRWSGLASENAAHRISVVGPDGNPSIWAPRRDTNSRTTTLLGKALYPNNPGRAMFACDETDDQFDISVRDADGAPLASVVGTVSDDMPGQSLFATADDACTYYRRARTGYSPGRTEADPDGRIALDIKGWKVTPLNVEHASSAVFDPLVAAGDAEFDHAVLMQNLPSIWQFGHGR